MVQYNTELIVPRDMEASSPDSGSQLKNQLANYHQVDHKDKNQNKFSFSYVHVIRV